MSNNFFGNLLVGFVLVVLAGVCLSQTNQQKPPARQSLAFITESLFQMAYFDDLEGLQKYLDRNLSAVNLQNASGDTLLIHAIKNDSKKVIQYLSQVNDLNVDLENNNQENALMYAAFNGDLPLVKYLIDTKQASIEKNGWSPMHYASTNGHLAIIRFLIEKDAYVDVESPNSTTPLMLASRAGHIQVVKYLLDNEADLAAKNQLELTAIDFANMGNQKEIVEGLKSRWKKMYQSEYILKPWP